MTVLSKIFGDANERYIKGLQPIVGKINSFEPSLEKLRDDELRKKTDEFKQKLADGQKLDDILPEAFASVRESAKRTLKQRHFDVQLVGGIVLHQGKIAEMKTGEGKTLAATLPAYLNALTGKGVHIVTVNDYLAKRDTIWMGQIYHLLGLSAACIVHERAFLYDPAYKPESPNSQTSNSKSRQVEDPRLQPGQIQNSNSIIQNNELDEERDLLGGFKVVEDFLRPVSRKEAYRADITYGTNNEFGFDYLRDNMVYDLNDQVQRRPEGASPALQSGAGGFNFAIVDEIDSILIDEARTPLIISSPDQDSTDKYYHFAKLVARLDEKADYEIDERLKAAVFTVQGQNKIIKDLGFDPWADNDVATIHQLESALRARTLFLRDRDYVVKEGQVMIVDEFTGRLMPGRRWSAGLHQAVEAKEGVKVQQESRTWATVTFQNYFRLYKKLSGMTGTALTSAEEFDKVYKLDVVAVPTNKPMIRKDSSDRIYKSFEGKMTALAKEIKERHRAGQPLLVGTVSIEKNEYLGKLLEREGIPHQILNAKNHEKEGEIIAQAGKLGAVTIATNMAGRGVDIILGGNPPDLEEQKKVISAGGLHVIGTERHEARRIDNQLRGRSGRQGDPGSSQFFVSIEDDLMRVFGGERIKKLMEALKIPEDQPIESKMISRAIESAQAKVEGFNFDLRKHILEYDEVMNKHREVFYKKRKAFLEISNFQVPISNEILNSNDQTSKKQNALRDYILEIIKKAGFKEEDYNKKEKEVGEENMRKIEKFVSLQVLDNFWIEHLENMERLRDSVRLRAYGQQDPLVEYKKEGHSMFKRLLATVDAVTANAVFQAKIQKGPEIPMRQVQARAQRPGAAKLGRNDPCPCGSGRKYKKCCYPKFG